MLSDVWNLLRSRDSAKSWSMLIWNKFVNPRLACFSWRLMHRKTPTEIWAKTRGWSLASRCHNCLDEEENDLHLFFFRPLAQQFWLWMLSLCGTSLLPPLSASSIWHSIAKGRDVSEKKCAAAIFLHAISVLSTLRNDSKHKSLQPSLKKAQSLFQVRLQNLVASVPDMASSVMPHPVLQCNMR